MKLGAIVRPKLIWVIALMVSSIACASRQPGADSQIEGGASATEGEIVTIEALAGGSIAFPSAITLRVVRGEALRRFLKTPLPHANDVDPDADLISVTEQHAGKKILFVRAARSQSGQDLAEAKAEEQLRYRDYATEPLHWGAMLKSMLDWVNEFGFNSPRGTGDISENYIVVTDDYIVFVCLPREKFKLLQ